MRYGSWYLRHLLDKYDDERTALAAYNAGEGNVWKYKGVPPFRETVTYINRIAKNFVKKQPAGSAQQTASR